MQSRSLNPLWVVLSVFLVRRAGQLLCQLSFKLNAQCLFFSNGLFTDKLKVSSVPEQPKEEKEVVKPSVAVAEPESSPNTVAEKPGKKTESARIQQKDKKRWVMPFRVPVNLLVDSLRGAGWSFNVGSPPVSIY